MRAVVLGVGLALIGGACASSTPAPTDHTSTASSLASAVSMAKATLPRLRERLATSTSATEVFGVLLDKSGSGCVDDHLDAVAVWLESVQLRGDVVSGIVDSAEGEGGKVISGDVDDVCDWVIADGDVIEGGFTLRAQRARLSPEEQAAFDESLGGHFAPAP